MKREVSSSQSATPVVNGLAGGGGVAGGGGDGDGSGGGGDGGGEQSTPHVALQNVCQHVPMLGCVHRFGYVTPCQEHMLVTEKPGHWKASAKSVHGAIGGAAKGDAGGGGVGGGGGEGQPTLHVRLQWVCQHAEMSGVAVPATQFWG